MALNVYAIKWPFALTSSNNDIVFSTAASAGTTTTETIAAGTYINRGFTTGSPTDLIEAFYDAASNAISTLGLGGSPTFLLGSDGILDLDNAGGSTLYVQWNNPSTTLDGSILGFDTSAAFAITASTVSPPYQVGYSWYPGAALGVPERDSDRRKRRVLSEQKTISGLPARNVHDSGGHWRRRLVWQFIPAARIVQSRTDASAYATIAGLSTGDPNAALENLQDYLCDATTPQPGQVYVVPDVSMPATQEGPYYVYYADTFPDDRGAYGVGEGMLASGFSSEHYTVTLELVEVPS